MSNSQESWQYILNVHWGGEIIFTGLDISCSIMYKRTLIVDDSLSWDHIKDQIQVYFTEDGYGHITRVDGKVPYHMGSGHGCRLMGIDNQLMWVYFVGQAKTFGLLDVYISGDRLQAVGNTSIPQVASALHTSNVINDMDNIDNPDSDENSEYSDEENDESEPVWVQQMRKEAVTDEKRYTPDVPIKHGMRFDTFLSLQDAVTKHCIKDHKIWVPEYKKNKSWAAHCWYKYGNPPCSWRVQASQQKNGEWLLKKFEKRHTCRPDYSHGGDDKNITQGFIARMIVAKVRVDPEYKVKLIQHEISELFNVSVTYKKCWHARLDASEMLYGSWEKSYKHLYTLLYTLQASYPGTISELVYTEPPQNINDEPTNAMTFKCAFWAFPAAINGLQYCMPIVTVDGTHLYGKYKGHLLLAVAMNGNRELFPLVYAVVDGETTHSWSWFLRLVAQKIIRDKEVALISDRHAGIINAYRDVPELRTGQIKKRFCLRHLRSNFNTKFHSSKLKGLMWAAGSTPSVFEFQKHMEEIRNLNVSAHAYLAKIRPELWTLSHDGGYRCGILTTNSSESFNNMLKGCRMLPVTAIVTMSYNKLIDQFETRRKTCYAWKRKNCLFTPKIVKIFHDREKDKQLFRSIHYGGEQYVVSRASRSDPTNIYNFLVDIGRKTCTCRQWSSDGIPCVHVHALYHSFRRCAYDQISTMYSVEQYSTCYDAHIQPVFFPQHSVHNEVNILPPVRPDEEISRPGRRQRNRFLGEMDRIARQRD